MELNRFQAEAMATRFEILIPQGLVGFKRARAASTAAFADLETLENELSKFRGNSDIYRLNRCQPGKWVGLGLAAVDCLSMSKAVTEETDGAFDISIGPLMAIWRSVDGSPRRATRSEAAEARERTGCEHLEIEPERLRARVHREGMAFDLGGMGKGYALDQMAEKLREWEIPAALLNAGDSTVLTLGDPKPEGESETAGWAVRAGGGEAVDPGGGD